MGRPMAATLTQGESRLRPRRPFPDRLQAAQFGRAFMDLYNPSDFVNMAQTLKVLNAVRYFEIGIPITYDQ